MIENNEILNRGLRVTPMAMLALIAFSIVLPTPSLVSIGTEMVCATLLIWMLFFVNRFWTISNQSKNLIYLSILYMLIIILYKITGTSTAGWEYMAGYLGWLVSEVIGIYFYYNATYSQRKRILFVIATTEIVNVIYIAVVGTRVMQNESEMGVTMTTAMFSTTFMLFSGILLILFLHTKQVLSKFIYFFAILLTIYVNFKVLQRGTNAILTVVMFVLIFLFNAKRSRRSYVIVFMSIILILTIYFTGAYVEILQIIENACGSDRLASRIHSINIFLQTGDYIYAGTSIRTRGMLLNNTWTTFTSSLWNILFGVGDHRATNEIIGNHSEIIDSLARYGIFVTGILIVLLKQQVKFIRKCFSETNNNRIYNQTIIVFIIYIIRNIIGDAFSTAVGILMFIFLPTMISLIEYEEQEFMTEVE